MTRDSLPDQTYEEYLVDYQLTKNNMDNFDLGKALWLRFLRGAIAGAVSTATAVTTALTIAGIHNWTDLKAFLITVGISLIAGGIGGGLLAIDKFIRA